MWCTGSILPRNEHVIVSRDFNVGGLYLIQTVSPLLHAFLLTHYQFQYFFLAVLQTYRSVLGLTLSSAIVIAIAERVRWMLHLISFLRLIGGNIEV